MNVPQPFYVKKPDGSVELNPNVKEIMRNAHPMMTGFYAALLMSMALSEIGRGLASDPAEGKS